MEHTIASKTAGMNTQAWLLMQYLSDQEIELPVSHFLMTRPYCNCREMGFVVQLHRPKGKPINWAFFEHRNSDSLCCLKWEGTTPVDGSVPVSCVPESVYPDKYAITKSWSYLAIGEAAMWLGEELAAAPIGE